MATNAESVTVGTTATLLSGTPDGSVGQALLVKVPSGGVTVYLGGSDVDTTDGFPVAASESVSFDANEEDALYGVVETTPQAVNVLRQGVVA